MNLWLALSIAFALGWALRGLLGWANEGKAFDDGYLLGWIHASRGAQRAEEVQAATTPFVAQQRQAGKAGWQ